MKLLILLLISFEEWKLGTVQRRGIIRGPFCLLIPISLFLWMLNYDIPITSDIFYFSVNSDGPKLPFKYWVPLLTHPHLIIIIFSSLVKLTVAVNIFRRQIMCEARQVWKFLAQQDDQSKYLYNTCCALRMTADNYIEANKQGFPPRHGQGFKDIW